METKIMREKSEVHLQQIIPTSIIQLLLRVMTA